jgi:hypothetical protein
MTTREPASERWIPFTYRDFYDVPHMIVLFDRGRCYLLDSPFDPALDDYRPDYQIFELPFSSPSELPPDWSELPARAVRRLGSLPVASLRLDDSRRQRLDASVLDAF